MKRLVFSILVGILCATLAQADDFKPVKPTREDKCPVCGMFVAKYPDFLCEIVFKDGSHAFFDGAKDMFKYYLNLEQYNTSQKKSDIGSVFVTDYYSLEMIDGLTAYYVLGSNIFGPMGRELIPFKSQAEAKDFMVDHSGKSMARFDKVTHELMKGLDR